MAVAAIMIASRITATADGTARRMRPETAN
jgi:hypothetical protein